MRILLTAFEPFDGSGLNASLAGCERFLQQAAGQFDLRFAVLPVRYGPDVEAVNAALAANPAEIILHVGQATGASVARVERLAVNVRYQDDDYVCGAAAGEAPQSLIDPEGPPALFSTLPVDGMAAAIRAAGVPAAVSNHAGIYLCNHALYRSLQRAERDGSGARCGFLHVPCLPEQGEGACMEASQIATAIHAALACLNHPNRDR
jgi:pyroglutamyl-peptidase